MQQIRERSPILREMIDNGQIGLVGGMYDLTTGEVHFYDKYISENDARFLKQF